jgi:hypothetical protein
VSKSQKPRKKHQSKPVVLPLGIRRADMMELPGFAASLALGQEWFCEQHVYDLLSAADLVRRIAKDGHPILTTAQAMVEACAAIQRRAQTTGKHGVSGEEFRVLRDGIGKAMEFLRGATNTEIVRASAAAVDEFNRTGVLRV